MSAVDPLEPGEGREQPMSSTWTDAVKRLRYAALDGGDVDEVHLYAVTATEERLSRWRSWLSPRERERVNTFGARSRREEFVAGRAAARHLLAAALDVDPPAVPLIVADDGAVDVGGREGRSTATRGGEWLLSITHCGPHAVAGIAPHPVGLDLEAIVERDPGLERFLMHPDDRGLLEALPYDHSASLVLVWTLKEAVLKARRSGFRTSPKKLRLSIHPVGEKNEEIAVQNENAHPASGQARISVEKGRDWMVSYTSVLSDTAAYWLAVAVPG